jgi:predicted transcriptional regulator
MPKGGWAGPLMPPEGMMRTRRKLAKIVVGIMIIASACYVITRIALSILLSH